MSTLRRRCRSGVVATAVLITSLVFAGPALAAPPSGSPSVQQYVETIPTVTGGSATGSSSKASSPTRGTVTPTSSGHSSSSGKTTPKGKSSGASSQSQQPTDTTSAASQPIHPRSSGSGGIAPWILIAIVLAAVALGAGGIAVARGRSPRTP